MNIFSVSISLQCLRRAYRKNCHLSEIQIYLGDRILSGNPTVTLGLQEAPAAALSHLLRTLSSA